MIDSKNFKIWLESTRGYTRVTSSNIVSRMKRVDNMQAWYDNPVYLFDLERNAIYRELSCSVRSQLKKAVLLYAEFLHGDGDNCADKSEGGHRILSLFANIGIAEAYLEKIGYKVCVANEIVGRRAALYSKIYRDTKMICGDILNGDIYDKIVTESLDKRADIIMATPPCQGMSTAGEHNDNDERNSLILPVINLVKRINPKYVFVENVPMFYKTSIIVDGEKILIPDLIKRELGASYVISMQVVNTEDYAVPQTRERAITLLSRNDMPEWTMPKSEPRKVTMKDAIGHLPMLDPFVKDVSADEMREMFPKFEERKQAALAISKWHVPPQHIKRQVVVMQHTATGQTAFDNERYYPVKEDGTAVKGYHNTYKRQNWDTPAYTVTMDNRKISSQNNVHPGRLEYINSEGEEIYSDARTLTLYELMKIMSLPDDWPIPDDTPEAFLRRIIGEGIPPLFVKKLFESLKEIEG